jgi:hypothetical protein
MELVPGAQLGQYRVVEQVGRGGMATVYKGFQPALNRYVAIKVLPAFFAEDPQFLERFRQEAQTVSQLRHPSILAVFDFGEQDGVTYMVSEFLGGGTLEQRLGQPLPLEQAGALLTPIAQALDYAHSRGMIHRDVKPSNILLADDGTPVLTDFGVARIVAGTTRLTSTGVAVGTPEYMAPEQAAGDPATPAVDRYALGIVLYELLTGRTPFQAETPVAVALAHLHKPLPLPRTLNPSLPEGADAVLLKALAKDPNDRYTTCQEMIAALRAVELDGSATAAIGSAPAPAPSVPPAAAAPRRLAAPTAPGDPTLTTTKRGSHVPIVAALVGMLLLVGLFAIWWFNLRHLGAPSQAPAPSKPAVQAPASGVQAPAAAPAPAASPAAAYQPGGQAVITSTSPVPPQKPGLLRSERTPLERVLPNLAGRLSGFERDDFSSPTGGIFQVPVSSPHGRAAYENGSLVVEYTRQALGDPPTQPVFAVRPGSFANGVIDVEARVGGDTDRAGVAIGFRRGVTTGNEGYFAWLRPRGKLVQFNKWDGPTFSELGSATFEAVVPDGVNRLTVVADGPSLQLYVNGQLALTTRDERFSAGRVSLAAGLSAGVPTGSSRVEFDDLRIASLR